MSHKLLKQHHNETNFLVFYESHSINKISRSYPSSDFSILLPITKVTSMVELSEYSLTFFILKHLGNYSSSKHFDHHCYLYAVSHLVCGYESAQSSLSFFLVPFHPLIFLLYISGRKVEFKS